MKKWLSLIFGFILMLLGNAQNQFDSTFVTKQGIKGNATFEYYFDIDHLPVKNGEFKFQSQFKDSNWTTVEEQHHWIGQYNENKKNGEWSYQVNRHELEFISIEDDHLEYTLRTIKTELKAYYKNGTPHKTWLYTSTLIEKGKPERTFITASIPFSNGKVNGFVSITGLDNNDQPFSINGNAEKGLFTGSWLFNYNSFDKQVHEQRTYQNGILLILTTDDSETSKTEIVYPLSTETQQYINQKGGGKHLVNKPYSILFNEGYPRRSNYIIQQKNGNTLLKGILDLVLRFENDYQRVNRLVLGSNRGHYPLTEEEKKYAAEWYKQETVFKDLMLELHEKRIQGYHLENDSTTLVLDHWIEKQEAVLKRVEPISKTFLSNEVEYYFRSNLLLNSAQSFLGQDSLFVNNNWIIYHYTIEETNSLLTYVLWALVARKEQATVFKNSLLSPSEFGSLDDELSNITAQIKKGKTNLDSIQKAHPDSKVLKTFNAHIDNYFIKYRLDGMIKAFHSTKDKKQQKAIGDSILLDFFELELVFAKSQEIANNINFVDSLYTEYVFDAFTFSDNVPTRFKKRLYDQYEKIAKQITIRASKSNSPKECIADLNTILEIQNIMVYLHDKNTKSLEKELQRANSLDKQIEILHEVL